MQVHKGSCHCGAVTFEVTGTVHEVTICNCSVCTKKGMGEGEMAEIARLLRRVLIEGEEPEAVGTDVASLVASFPGVQYCF